MKKIAKCFDVSKLHIIAFAVGIAFSMAACGDKDDDGGGNGNGDGNNSPTTTSFGNTMTLSGQVYLYKLYSNGFDSYSPFNGNLTINCPYGGTGQVTNGNLNYTIGIPLINLEIFEDLFEGSWDNVNVTPSRTVRGVFLESLPTNSNNYWKLSRELYTQNNSYTGTNEYVIYFYVNNDVTVITRDMNLTFKQGWNTVYSKAEITFSGTIENETITYYSTSLSNPSHLRWVTKDYKPISVQTDYRVQGAWALEDYVLFINAESLVVKYKEDVTTSYRTEWVYATGTNPNTVDGDIKGTMTLFDYKTNDEVGTLSISCIPNDSLTVAIESIELEEYYYNNAFPREGTYEHL